MEDRLSWKDVLDCSKKWYGVITKAEEIARKAGYNYFSFNGVVYAVITNGYYCTHIESNTL